MPKFNLSYHRVPDIIVNDMSFSNFQFYNPLYSELFNLDETNYNKITLNNRYHFLSPNIIYDYATKEHLEKDIFIKYSPLIDPSKYMAGKYCKYNISLPTILDTSSNVYHRIVDPNNVSYVDNFFYYLSSKILNEHDFVNSIDYYGSFLCIKENFKYDISDDIEYLYSSEYFNKNLNNLFTVNETNHDYYNFGSRAYKKKLNISQSEHNINILTDDLDIFEIEDVGNEIITDLSDNIIYENNDISSQAEDSDSESSNDSELNYSSSENSNTERCDDDAESEEENDEESDMSSFNDDKLAYINEFPVQSICIEKCDGTLDNLFETEQLSSHEGICAIFQVIMTLLCYQKTFFFTHNDLHTNNVMYINTNQKFLYYKFNKQLYKVPTYGKIYKIIDFGRSIFRFNNRLFCSDSFGPDGDASTQYNCEPYFNPNKPRIDPNFSFDLCRLGCSIYDFIIDDDENPDDFNDLQKIVKYWCTDDDNKNILYKKSGEERYPNFKLYKMIARTVHKHTPEAQLKIPIFKQFEINKVDFNILDSLIDIDVIPSYI